MSSNSGASTPRKRPRPISPDIPSDVPPQSQPRQQQRQKGRDGASPGTAKKGKATAPSAPVPPPPSSVARFESKASLGSSAPSSSSHTPAPSSTPTSTSSSSSRTPSNAVLSGSSFSRGSASSSNTTTASARLTSSPSSSHSKPAPSRDPTLSIDPVLPDASSSAVAHSRSADPFNDLALASASKSAAAPSSSAASSSSSAGHDDEVKVAEVSLTIDPNDNSSLPDLMERFLQVRDLLDTLGKQISKLDVPSAATADSAKDIQEARARVDKQRALLDHSKRVLTTLNGIDDLILEKATSKANCWRSARRQVALPDATIFKQTEADLNEYYDLISPFCQVFGSLPLGAKVVPLQLAPPHPAHEYLHDIMRIAHPDEVTHDSSYGLMVHEAVAEAYLFGQLGFEPVVHEGVPKVRVKVPADSTHFDTVVEGQSIGSRDGQFLHGISADHAPQGMLLAWTLGYALSLEFNARKRVEYFKAAMNYERHMNPRVKHPAKYPGET